MSAIIVEAPVLEVEHRKGEFKNDAQENISYDFHLVHLHMGGANMLQVKFKNDNGEAPLPKAGEVVRLEVEVPRNTRVIAKRYAVADGKH